MSRRVGRYWAGCALLVLAPVLLTSCSWPVAESCDGKRPIATVDAAVRGLLTAAESGDLPAACSVITGHHADEELTAELAELGRRADDRGITPDTAVIVEGEQGGSLLPVEVSGGEDTTSPIKITILVVRDDGYRVMLPLD